MVRPAPMGAGIPPRHVRDGPCFHFAFGFRTAQRLARMLDSLVRVSRRVGWRADRCATDPVPAGPPRPSKEAVGRHGCPVSASRTSQESEAAYADGGSSVPKRIGTGEPIRSGRRSGHPPCSPPSDRSRTGRGALPAESAHGDPTSKAEGESVRISHPNRRRASELNSAGRLCGSTRLPLGGFTYC